MQVHNTAIRIQPRWLGVADAATYSGVSQRLLENWVRDGLVVASLVRAPGKAKGRRLIDRESIDRHIEAGIGRFTELAMNKPKGAAQSR